MEKEAGGKWRETENAKELQSLGLIGLKNEAQIISNEEEVKDWSVTAKKRPKSNKLKHLARDICAKDESKMAYLLKNDLNKK